MQNDYSEKERFLIYALPLVILTSFAISYWPVFRKLEKQWSGGDNSYCYLIVPLFLYLCWDIKDRFHFREFSWNPWGLLPALLSVMLIIVGELGSVRALMFIGIWGCVVGLAVTLYGRRVRHLFFPLVVLFFIVPIPPFVNRMLTFKLKMAASTLSVKMLRVLGVSVFQTGNIIDIGIDKLQVVDACSGLRYFMPMILLSMLIAYFFVKSWWRWAVLFLMIVPLSISINAFRIWVSALLIVNGYPELAEDLFHDFTGWLVFMIAAAVLVAVAFLLKKIGSNPGARAEPDQGGRSGGSVLPVALSLIFCLLFVGSGWALKNIPSAKNLPQRKNFDSFPMQIGAWKGKRSYLSEQILNSLWADDYVTATYYKEGSPNLIYLLIPFYEYQATNHAAHTPQSCLLGGGYDMLKSGERPVQVAPDRKIEIMTMVLKKGSTRLLGSYFFFQKGRVLTSPWQNKFYLMWDAFTRKRTDGALVRVEMTMAPGQSQEDAFVVLEDFVSRLWKILPDYVPL
jgi:exosortase D (VPLPA-CTERM-specific)